MLPRLHLVTDDTVLGKPDFLEVAAAVLEACGADVALHVRARRMQGALVYDIARASSDAAIRTGAWLLVNDRVDIARAVRANGVQLTARSLDVADARALLGTHAAVGCSVHDAAEAAEAAARGADWVIVGSVWPTASHPGGETGGTALVERCVERARLPVIAIGGVTVERLPALRSAGAYGAAVLSGVWGARDPVQAARAFAAGIGDQWGRSET